MTITGTAAATLTAAWLQPGPLLLDGRGRDCQALVVRLPGGTRAHELSARLDTTDFKGVRIWETFVPSPQDSPSARERTRREVLRPVHGEPGLVRAVLLRYADATANLVLVARRGSRDLLDRTADALLGVTRDDAYTEVKNAAPEARWAAPEWGMGDPARPGFVSVRTLPLPSGERAPLLGAIALTLARYSGEPTVEFGLIDNGHGPNGHGPQLVRVCSDDEEQGASDYLAQLDIVDEAAQYMGVVFSTAADDRVHVPFQAPPFPLTLHVTEHTGEAAVWFDEGAIAERVAEDFGASVARLAAALTNGTGTLAGIPVLTEEQTARTLRSGGAGVGPSPAAHGRIDRRFEEVAARRPDAVAVVDDEVELTYRELDGRANAVAAGLRALGVGPGARIGVCLDRDASLVVAVLGVLKAGCAYVPMDLRNPPDRLRLVAEDAGLPLVIADPAHFPRVENVRVKGLDELKGPGGPARAGTPDDTAYVIYTSGSTGRPKGVLVPHRNVLALLEATTGDFGLGPDDTWTLFHSSAFDFSVWEIWGCLLTGGRLVVVPYWTARDTTAFRRLLAERRVTVLSQTPSAFTQLVRADERADDDLAVRLLVFGGEPLDVRLLAPWFARHSPTRCRAVNMFGITETTVHVTARTVTPSDLVAGSRSVGRALPGWSVSVRDPRGRVLPPGAAGEIWVGGAGVAD
ncbi:peptide synthetase, partial [Actinomadura logoneensis]